MRVLARLLVRVFFRRIDVAGAERLPAGPTVIVANHTNGLVDGLLLIATLGRYPRFLGKATLFSIPPLRLFLRLAGVVPVHRLADGAGTQANAAAFARCREVLVSGGVIGLFPEGISHDEATLQPLRTGAARIALDAAGNGASGVQIVAVGLVYDEKARFRSSALVRIGAPHAVPVGIAVRVLTADIAGQLADAWPQRPASAEADGLARGASVVARPESELPMAVDLETAVLLEQSLVGAPSATRDHVVTAMADYDEARMPLRAGDADVAATFPERTCRRRLLVTALELILLAPYAVVGAVVHFVAYRIVKVLGTKPTNVGIRSTVKLFGCFTLFTLTYLALAVVAALSWSALAGVVVMVAAPVTGYAALRFGEAVRRFQAIVRGRRRRRDPRMLLAASARARVVDLVQSAVGSAI